MDREQSVQHFLDLLKKSRRGNFKIYIGMIAGVGKSYRMLSDAHQLLESGIDVKIGYIETHGRVETEALVEGLPIIPRRKIFYKEKRSKRWTCSRFSVSILKLSSLTNWLIPMSKAVRTKSVGRMSWIYWMPVSV